MRAIVPLLPVLAVLLGAAPAAAQDASGCAKFKWKIDRERSAFGTPGLQIVQQGKPLPGIMDPAVVALEPVSEVRFERPPGRKPRDGTYGGVFKTPPLAVGGLYQITISDEAWIDVIQDGRELRPKDYTGVAGCPNVRKSLRFDLGAGQATVQFSGSNASSIKVDVLPPPEGGND